MKKILNIALVLLVGLTSSSVFAQKGQRGQNIDELKSQLNLNAEQIAAFEKMKTTNKQKMKSLKNDESMSKEDKRAAFMELRKDQKAATDKILTTEQKAKLSELKKDKRKEQKVKHAEKSAERKEKAKQIQSLRAEFDQQIADDDKERIAELRTIFKEKRGEMRGKSKKGGKRSLSDEEKTKARAQAEEKRAQFKAEYKAEIEELEALNEKYSSDIKAFMKEKGIANEEKVKERRSERKAQEKAELKGRKGHKKSRRLAASKFLLMDFETSAQNATIEKSEINIFPNPSSTWTNIEYEVRASGMVKVIVKDEQGNTIQTLVNEKADKGNYTIEFNTSSLSNKNYFIVVSDAQGSTSKSLISIK